MGSDKGVQPLRGKESVRPALMIAPAFPSTPPLPSTQDTAQAHPHPFIEPRERGPVAVFEITKPALCTAIDVSDDGLQTLPIRAFGFDPYRIFELLETLLAGPFVATFEVISQKVKATPLGSIHDARLCRMQC